MKRILLLTLLALSLTSIAQNGEVNIGVIPTPQQVVMRSGTCSLTTINPPRNFVSEIAGAQNQHQAYRIEIAPTGVTVYVTSNEGWDYAIRTLTQLKEIYHGQIPCMTITDWPAFEYRGWLDDISRGPIPNKGFRRRMRKFCDQYKMNFGNYYTEHTLYNELYPDVSGASGIADYEYANDPYMMANLQCFAHFEKTLRIPYYQILMDSPTNVNPSKEETYVFLRNQIENTVAAYHSSHFFNINCDETEGLGSGRAKEYVSKWGADEVYCQHINRVYDMVQEAYGNSHDGKKMEVLMWGDIVGKNPEMLKKLPKEMQYIVWSYGAQENYNQLIAPFAKLHNERGTQFWVAPGVSHWSTQPLVHNYIQNIAYLARDGHKAGARGLMNTAWDDSGESLMGDCWHAMAWAAEMAWHPLTNSDPQKAKEELVERERIFNENYDRLRNIEYNRLYKTDMQKSVSKMVYAVGELADNPYVDDWCNTSALMLPLTEFYPAITDRSILTRCDSVQAAVNRALSIVDSNMEPHLAYFCHRLLCVAQKNRLRVMLYQSLINNGANKIEIQNYSKDYFRDLHNLKLEYLRLWDDECTDYSRDIICDRYDWLGREVYDFRQKVFISNSYKDRKMYVTLQTLFNDRPIYFTVDGRKPSQGASLYRRSFTIGRSCIVKAVTYNKWGDPVYSEQYLLYHKAVGNLKKLNTTYSDYRPAYSGGGNNALVDGILGSDNNFADGHWQGYWGKDIDVELDLKAVTSVKTVTMRFLQNSLGWILTPETIEVYTSADGTNWKKAHTEHYTPDFREPGNIIRTNAIRDLDLNTRYLRIVAKNPGRLPSWHPAPGAESYLFCDEIVVE